MSRQNAWIDVYPFNGRNLAIHSTGKKIGLEEELSQYVRSLPEPKFNSWVPVVNNVYFGKTNVSVQTGVASFKTVKGITESLAKQMPFAPEIGFNPSLSVGFLTATKDSKVIFQRRPGDVLCPNTLIHEPCGYMASGYINPRPEHVDDEKLIQHPRLYDVQAQLDRRKKEIAGTFDLSEELVSYDHVQDFLAAGWLSKEMYFSTTGKIGASESELMKNSPKGEFFFVPFEHLTELIYNQGRLSQINPTGYRPSDSREIPLIDESLIGLVHGYEKLTGDKLDVNETIEQLNHSGLDIKLYDTSAGMGYKFPTKF